MSQGLHGRRILIPRGGPWGQRALAEVHSRGGEGVIAPLIEAKPPLDTAARDGLLARLEAAEYSWLFITSASTVEQLAALGTRIPASMSIAAVGPATARALRDANMRVDFLPTGPSSALGMIRQWCREHAPSAAGRALVLRSDLAMAAVSDELEIQGYLVDVGLAYRTVGVDLPQAVLEQFAAGQIDAVLLTSGSVARELHQQVGESRLGGATLIAIGPSTQRVAEKLGLVVSLTAEQQSVESMLERLDQEFSKEIAS